MTPIDPLADLCRTNHPLRAAIGHMVDRYERRGRWTRTVTVRAVPGLDARLCEVFSARAIKVVARGIVVDVARAREALPGASLAANDATDPLATRLYRALDREPRDERAEALERRRAAESALADVLGSARTEAARAWARCELDELAAGSGELHKLATPSSDLARLARDVARTIDGAIACTAPVRIQTFSAKTLGSSKALRPGGDLFRLASAALYDHDSDTRALTLQLGDPASLAHARRDALEARGIYRDEVAASVLCFGPITYRKGRERFDHVARHAQLGESCRLVQHQLRDAVLEPPPARRVTIFENLTPYLEYVDAMYDRGMHERGETHERRAMHEHERGDPREIVVCASGQASWAVVRLLEMCARHGLPMRFAGDLDRTGVLILRSLRKRAGARVEPFCMGVPTHRRFASRGQPIAPRELAHLQAMLVHDPPSAPCHELLVELLRSKVWIEQEAFADECLARVLAA